MKFGEQEFNNTLLKIVREDLRHPNYERTVELAHEMAVHVYGEKPVKLLDRVRPGEDEDIKQYRLLNYEPTTKAPCGKAIKIVSKMFNPNLSSIRFKSDTDGAKRLHEYTMEYYPEYNTLTAFNKDVTLKKMIADPNGVIAVKPMKAVENDAEAVMPIVVIYGSDNVWYYDIDHYLIFIKKEEIKDKGILYTFDYYDDEWYRRFTVMAPREDKIIIEDLPESYPHKFLDKDNKPEIPAWKLRGNTIALDNGELIYESFFADAQPHWNLSIIHESDVLGAFVKHMNPQRYIVGETCTNTQMYEGIQVKCHRGTLTSPDGKTRLACDVCGGTGKVASSPYEDHIILKSKLDEMQNVSIDSVGYVKVQTEATKMLEERADKCVEKGSSAINMDIEDKVGENQSGIAKVYDRSAQNDTIYDMACVMYDIHFQNEFYFINKYMNAVVARSVNKTVDDNLPEVNKPTRFNIESIAELIAGFEAGKKSGLDRNFLQAKELEILNRELDTDPDRKKYYSLIISLDPLFGMTQIEIDSNLNRGLIRKVDAVIHANLKLFVDRAIRENKNFEELERDKQFEILDKYALEIIDSEKVTLDFNEPQ